jgi:hypothetical protein
LIETPGHTMVCGLPSLPTMRSASKPSPWLKTWKKPHGGSSASVPPVKPRAASSAATTPLCAARPTCSGFVIVPKFTRMPAAVLAAMASVCAVFARSRPRSFAVATAAPNVPTVPDEWNPFL